MQDELGNHFLKADKDYCHVHYDECEGPYETRVSIYGASQTLCKALWATANCGLWPGEMVNA